MSLDKLADACTKDYQAGKGVLFLTANPVEYSPRLTPKSEIAPSLIKLYQDELERKDSECFREKAFPTTVPVGIRLAPSDKEGTPILN